MSKIINSGRKKGSLNKISKDTRGIIKDIVNNELKGLSNRINTLSNSERIHLTVKLLPFIIPTYQKIIPTIFEDGKEKGFTLNIVTEDEETASNIKAMELM